MESLPRDVQWLILREVILAELLDIPAFFHDVWFVGSRRYFVDGLLHGWWCSRCEKDSLASILHRLSKTTSYWRKLLRSKCIWSVNLITNGLTCRFRPGAFY